MARLLNAGDPVPWFQAPLLGGKSDFKFERMGGRHVLLLFFGTAAQPACAEALRLVERHQALFDGERAAFFGVTALPEDVQAKRLTPARGIHFFMDYERHLSALFGASGTIEGKLFYQPHWLVVDRALRVVGRFRIGQGEEAIATLSRAMARPEPEVGAPILAVSDVLEEGFRQKMIDLYHRHGGGESGFMRQEGNRTVGVVDRRHKSRADHVIEDESIRLGLRARLVDRLLPMIERCYDFRATRIERYIVACYDSETGGHFAAHRDNLTTATAHRRFAVTINLNGDYEGGDISFPEFGTRSYRAPPGGAIVFACALMHEVGPVTAGRRFATLPFLYDDAAAKVREANHSTLADATDVYRADKAAAS